MNIDVFDLMTAAIIYGPLLNMKPHYETAPRPVNDTYHEETDNSSIGYWDEDGNFIEY